MAESLTITPMTEREFGNVFATLAIQLRWMDADVVAVKSYYEALKDLPLEAVQASAAEIARTGYLDEKGEHRTRFFPTSADWRTVAQKATVDVFRKALPAVRDEPWRVECEACDDTGWELFECTGDAFCGRQKTHAAHTFVRVCPCRPTNRTYQRHQKFGAGA